MAARSRLAALSIAAGLGLLGLAIGAESQREELLQSDLATQEQINQEASGNLIVLTGLVASAGFCALAWMLSRQPPLRRLAAGLGLLVAVYVVVQVVQTAWPNYDAQIESRAAEIAVSPLASNAPAVPSLFLPVFAIVAGAILVAFWALRRLLGDPEQLDAQHLLDRQAAATAGLVPFLAIASAGSLRLLLDVPSGPGSGLYLVLLPLASLACATLAVLELIKVWQLGLHARDTRLAPAVDETWKALGRAEMAVVGLLVAVALVGSLLERLDLALLQSGRTFGVTLRGHTQFFLLLFIPILPLLHHQRVVAQYLATPRGAIPGPGGAHAASLGLVAAACIAFLLTFLTTFALAGALWPWLLAALPMAAAAWRNEKAAATLPLLLAAFAAWCIGNTIVASYRGAEGAALVFADSAGSLALWRSLAALLGGLAMFRLARRLGNERRSIALVLAGGIGVCAAGVALLELPLAVWTITAATGESVGVGTVVASQDAGVRITMHAVSMALTVSAALLAARLHRPEWFMRPRPPPLAAPQPTKTPSSAN